MSDREFGCKTSISRLPTFAQADMFGFTLANDDLSLPKGITESCAKTYLKHVSIVSCA